MSDTVKDRGRVRYIEPSNICLSRDGSFSDAINFPYEDYNMAVDLSIKKVHRYSGGWWKESGEFKEITYSSKNGTISFLGGTRGYESLLNSDDSYLTTNFTDISMTEPETNTSECLGIESISITYNSWMYPQVVIKFVDIRGATIMQPAERGYYNPSDAGLSSELYKSLFTFPYPIFTLKVKGFYGKGVTYKLAVEKNDLEFDSNTGNFNITVSFIGYMFGVYADMPMTYLAIAPYMREGKEYWKRKVDDGTFRFRDANGNESIDMMTIPELRLKLARAANSEESVSIAADGEQAQNNYDERMSKLSAIREDFPFKDWFEINGVDYVYKIVKTEEEMEGFRNTVSGYVMTVSGYDVTYGEKYLDKVGDMVKYAQDKYDMPIIEYKHDKNSASRKEVTYRDNNKNKTRYEKYVLPYEEVRRYISDCNSGLTHFYLYIFPKKGEVFNIKKFSNDTLEELERLRDKKAKSEAEYKQKQNSAIEKAIGFRPSIKNIYDLMFAHMETFLHCFYSSTKTIKDQLESNADARKKSYQLIFDGDTDTENEKVKNSAGINEYNTNANCKYLPPYAAYYKETYINNEVKKELRWPGELIHGKELEEVYFVESLLAAAELYADKAESVEEAIAAMSSGNSKIDLSLGNDGTPNPMVHDFIPLTTYDFVYKDKIGNPYDSVKDKVYFGDDAVCGDILGIFALRAFYYLSTNKDGWKDAKSFGTLEAINLYKAIKDKYSEGFVNFIKKYANDNKSNRNGFIETITTTNSTPYTSVWQTKGAPNLNMSLFKKKDGYLFFNLHKGFKIDEAQNITYQMFPLYFWDFKTIRKDYANEKDLLNNRNYISLTDDGIVYSSEEGEVSTFIMYESRDYIKNVFTCLEDEVNRTQTYLKENKKNYGNRKADEYGDIKKTNRTLKNYKDNIESSFGEKAYERDIIVDSSESSISMGKIKEVVSNGGYEEQQKYYIKYPAILDENESNSLFATPIYHIQTDIKAKAFLFLQAVPIKGSAKTGGIERENMNGLTLKARLLREGSYYWREDNPDAIIFSSNEPGFELSENYYKKPKVSQSFAGDRHIGEYETFHLLRSGESGDYPYWENPYGNTASRRRFLKKYFEDWATSTDDETGFAANESRLINVKLYDKKPNLFQREKYASESSRTFGKGLDIDGIAASSEPSETATEAKKLQKFLRNLFFTVCTTIDLYNGTANPALQGEKQFCCSEDAMKKAFEGFMEELELIYGQVVDDIKDDVNDFNQKLAEAEAKNPFKNNDLRLSTYMTLKSLYDKWLCSPYNGPLDTWTLSKNRNGVSDFDNFVYTDTFYHDIGYQLIVNITKISSFLSSCLPTSNMNTTEGILQYTGRTIYEFLAEVAQDCGGMLLALPQRFGLADPVSIENMFKPISIKNDWDEDSSSFVFMYTYKPSEHLGSVDPGNMDMNGWSPKGDGVDLTDDEIVGKILSDESPYTIPAFAVTYAKQNQSLFKNIRLSTVSAGVTEASLAATFNIASKSSESPRESALYGQDLYRVFSQYSYQCSVEMMGNMQITPLMYFQLNNVPMWKGAYQIKKVSHNITPGNMTTTFEGVRINRYAIPLTDSAVIIAKDTGNNVNDGYPVGGDNNPTTGPDGKVAKGGNDVNIDGNRDITLKDSIDFTESNISETKPIICLTPAHGPKTQKSKEWKWSNLLLDRVEEILKGYKFKDGTSYALNIQRCNKNGSHTGSDGYSMRETKALIEKYGSKQVISVVPHWNGGAGNYHITFIDKESNGPRTDSLKLAECFQSEFNVLRNKKATYTNMPPGMMNGDCRLLNFWEDTYDSKTGEWIKHTDGAPQQKCACVLTENWFADYPSGCPWKDDKNYNSGSPYASGRGWLMSAEGIEEIAQAHAKAIKRYIDTL